MKIIKYFYLLFIIIILTGCDKNSSMVSDSRFGYTKKFGVTSTIPELKITGNSVKTILIPGDINNKSIPIDSLFSTVKFVQLETNDESLINKIDKLLFIGDKIIIFDKKNQKVFMFSNQGKFITKVGSKGHGPNEYIGITTVLIDSKKNQIIIIDNRLQKMFCFDVSGKLVKQRKMYYYIDDMAILNNGSAVVNQLKNQNLHLAEIKEYQIVISDSSQKIKKKSFSYNLPKNNIDDSYAGNNQRFNVIGNRVLFNPLFTNLIYEFNEFNTVELKYEIKLGEKDILNNLENYKSVQDITDVLNERLFSFSGLALTAGSYLFSTVDNGGCFFYNNLTGKLIYGNSISFDEDKILPSKLTFLLSETIASTGSNFVSFVYPSDLFIDGKGQTPKKYRNVQNLVKINDNPILVFYTIKN